MVSIYHYSIYPSTYFFITSNIFCAMRSISWNTVQVEPNELSMDCFQVDLQAIFQDRNVILALLFDWTVLFCCHQQPFWYSKLIAGQCSLTGPSFKLLRIPKWLTVDILSRNRLSTHIQTWPGEKDIAEPTQILPRIFRQFILTWGDCNIFISETLHYPFTSLSSYTKNALPLP